MPAKTETPKADKGKSKRGTREKAVESKLVFATPSIVKAATQTVSITKAKGRPMLAWVGKRPLTQVIAFPAQHVETFDPDNDAGRRKEVIWHDWPKAYPHGGLLFHGDNKEVLAHLLANGFRGKVNLIYIDPPFDSGADYVRKISLRGSAGTAKLDGEGYTLGEQIQYTDIWANDNYLQFIYERLLMLKELLANDGSIWLHCDPRRGSLLRVILDEAFGQENFQNDIVWQRTNAHNIPTRTFVRSHDLILFYSKTNQITFSTQYEQYSQEQLARYKPDEKGRLYTGQDLTFSTINPDRQFEWRGAKPPPGRSWGFSFEELDRLWSEGRILKKKDSTPRLDGLKVYLDETSGKPLTTIWVDVARIGNTSSERLNYPTQKPESLLHRIIESSSSPGDVVLDCFIGSGTTAAVAQKLGRRWIGCDINKGAIQTTSKRLQMIITEQIAAEKEARKQGELIPMKKDDAPKPAQLSFGVYRVNDYDLQIQHNEAVNLACEHIGVIRSRTDVYFDGTLGKRLAKESLFFIPAQRVLTLGRGWPRPFSDYGSGDPFSVRDFSEKLRLLMEAGWGHGEGGAIFPQTRRLKDELRRILDQTVFHGFGLRVDTHGTQKRLVLKGRGTEATLPFMVWSAGQREFVPLLMGFYWLLPPTKVSRRQDVEWVVIEEPETGLHPNAISAVLLLILDLLARGYRVCLSTHSPHVLDVVWALKVIREHQAPATRILDLFETRKTLPMKGMAAEILRKIARVYYFNGETGCTRDISGLDPGSQEASEAGWGGLSEFSGHVAEVVANVVNTRG